MSTRWGVRGFAIAAFVGVIGAFGVSSPAQAQYQAHFHHRHSSHHHHDAMGHRVDDAGHHIDLHGHHTGAVGVYDNGARSLPSYSGLAYPSVNYSTTYGGRTGYWSNGSFIYSSAPATVLQGAIPVQPVVVGRPPQNVLPGMAGQPAPVPGKITILNPPGSGGEVRYRLNDSDFVIKEGFAQTIENDRNWIVHFDSGGSGGEVRYTLSPGTFKFKVTETGWNLLRTTDPLPTSPVNSAPQVRSSVPAPTPQPDGP